MAPTPPMSPIAASPRRRDSLDGQIYQDPKQQCRSPRDRGQPARTPKIGILSGPRRVRTPLRTPAPTPSHPRAPPPSPCTPFGGVAMSGGARRILAPPSRVLAALEANGVGAAHGAARHKSSPAATETSPAGSSLMDGAAQYTSPEAWTPPDAAAYDEEACASPPPDERPPLEGLRSSPRRLPVLNAPRGRTPKSKKAARGDAAAGHDAPPLGSEVQLLPVRARPSQKAREMAPRCARDAHEIARDRTSATPTPRGSLRAGAAW